MATDVVDYQIHGAEMQFVEIELDSGEAVVAEAGAMMFMSGGIEMKAILGDGSEATSGLFGKLLGVGKRMLTGESLFMTLFSNGGGGRGRVGFSAPYPGRIVPIDLARLGGEVLCQKDAFLCAARGTELSIAFQKKLGAGLFGGEGFIMERLRGDGLAFVHASGTVIEKDLAEGESLRVDTGSLVALTPSVKFEVELVGGIKSMMFGGEGIFVTSLQGPGRVWMQSLPFARLAARIHEASPDAEED
jgi:uncharacterized protein (TIGR00266 family)